MIAGTLTTPAPVVEKTGELIQPETPITVGTLRDYVSAKHEAVALSLQLQATIDEIIAEHPEVAKLRDDAADASARARAVEVELAGAFSEDVRKGLAQGITLDASFIRVTWPKPAERWNQRVKPKHIAARYPKMAATLGITLAVSKPSAPRITIRDEVSA